MAPTSKRAHVWPIEMKGTKRNPWEPCLTWAGFYGANIGRGASYSNTSSDSLELSQTNIGTLQQHAAPLSLAHCASLTCLPDAACHT